MTQPSALAQNVAPFGFTLVLGTGVQVYVNMGGVGLWHGITEDGVDAANFGSWVTGIAPWVDKKGSLLPREKVQYACPEHCRKMYFGDIPKEDTVAWKDGTKTTGRIEVRCQGSNYCAVYQDGKPRQGKNDWTTVDYLYLAPPKP